MSDTTKIFNCPFCGEKPCISPGGDPSKKVIACENKDCHAQPMVIGETEAEAVAQWTKRTPDYPHICSVLGSKVIWALKYLDSKSGSGCMMITEDTGNVKIVSWLDDFADALKLVGWNVNMEQLFELRNPSKKKKQKRFRQKEIGGAHAGQ
jgi:hypothetical protein